jgi:hypothetical protein
VDLGADYPPASYSLKYSLRLENVGTEIEINASEIGSDYIVEVASSTTVGYAAGRYHWQAYIIRTSDSERLVIGAGTLELKPNRDAASTDPRSHVKRTLDTLEVAIEALASGTLQSYTILGRTATKKDLAGPNGLIVLRDKYKAEYQRELDVERVAKGLGSSRRIGVRFARP